MKAQLAIQQVLQQKLAEIQRQNPRFSLRSFANRIGINAGALSYIMNGKRRVSRRFAERIANQLVLDPQKRYELLQLFPEKFTHPPSPSDAKVPESRYLELNAAQFKLVAEWEHFAVMSLVRCVDFVGTDLWIAERLGIPRTRSKQVIDRLVQLDLLVRDKNGYLSPSKKSYRTTDDIAEVSIKKCHEQTLELARESLYRDDVQCRDFTSITFAVDVAKLGTAKERIRKFQDELSDLLEKEPCSEVYRLAVQLFPLSVPQSTQGNTP